MWTGIAYGSGKFVVTGRNGRIVSSTDGKNWATPQQVGTKDNWWGAITYGNGKFVVTEHNGKHVTTSTDGENWTNPQQV